LQKLNALAGSRQSPYKYKIFCTIKIGKVDVPAYYIQAPDAKNKIPLRQFIKTSYVWMQTLTPINSIHSYQPSAYQAQAYILVLM
jgi:hypothetical protein